MNTNQILLGVGALWLFSRARRASVAQQRTADYLNDPTTWGSDMWSRMYGDDLAMVGGQHNCQCGLTAYGASQNAMGFIGSAAR